MTRERDIEHLLDTWFRDGPTEAPDRIVDAVADRIGRQSQRPAWRLDWRHLHMTSTVKLATALAAIAIVAFLGWRFLPDSSGGVGGDPAPSSSPSASASPSIRPSSTPVACEDDLAGCAGLLAAGNHRSNQLVPAISFETPANWKNVIDLPALYKIDPPRLRQSEHPRVGGCGHQRPGDELQSGARPRPGSNGRRLDRIRNVTSRAGRE